MQPTLAPLSIRSRPLDNPVMPAPMSGVTDLPFRRLAQELVAGLVVSEMVASEALVRQHPDVLRNIANFYDQAGELAA